MLQNLLTSFFIKLQIIQLLHILNQFFLGRIERIVEQLHKVGGQDSQLISCLLQVYSLGYMDLFLQQTSEEVGLVDLPRQQLHEEELLHISGGMDQSQEF